MSDFNIWVYVIPFAFIYVILVLLKILIRLIKPYKPTAQLTQAQINQAVQILYSRGIISTDEYNRMIRRSPKK